MTIYVVTIRPGSHERYTDSLWVERTHAEDRVNDLIEEFARRGRGDAKRTAVSDGWAAWITTAKITDAEVVQQKTKTLKK